MSTGDVPAVLADRPFAQPIGELVARLLVLWFRFLEARPELQGGPGTLHVTFDGEAGTILLGLAQADGRVTIVGRFHADPRDQATFGTWDLPVTAAPGALH